MKNEATRDLAEAKQELEAARAAYDRATTKRARREAAEEIEFWGNKAAFFSNVRVSR